MRVIDKQDYEIYSLDYMLRRERSLLLEQAQAELWNNGFVSIGEVTQASARYVAGYVDKKLEVNRSNYYYKQLGIEPEKLYISNGIGLNNLNFRLFNHPSINFYRFTKDD